MDSASPANALTIAIVLSQPCPETRRDNGFRWRVSDDDRASDATVRRALASSAGALTDDPEPDYEHQTSEAILGKVPLNQYSYV